MTPKYHNMSKIPDFLTKKTNTILFLTCVFIFSALFVIVYNPTNPPEDWNKVTYTATLVGSAFIVLIVSRILMHAVNKKSPLLLWQYIIWLAGEITLFVFGLTLFSVLLNKTSTDFTALLGRVAIDVGSILLVPYTVTVLLFLLHEKKQEIARLLNIIDKQANTTAMPSNTVNFYDRSGKLAFSTRRSNILYIESADNYCNIHYMNENKDSEDTFILHNSMKYFETYDTQSGLLRCHRGYIVNMENVRLLRKDGEKLVLELTKGAKSIPVSRSYKERVVGCFTAVDTINEQDKEQ